MHEDFSREEPIEGSSDRGFGFVFAGLFAVVGLWQVWSGGVWHLLWLLPAGLFFLLAVYRPQVLAPFNRQWTKLGLILFRVVNPIILAILFFGVVLPTGLLMRLAGKDPMNRHYDRAARSYWVLREPPGPRPETMKDQF